LVGTGTDINFQDHHFLLGHTIREFTSGSPNEPFTSWMRKWPEQELIRYITIGNKEAVLVTGLQALKEVLQTNAYTFVKPAGYKRVSEPIVGKGLFLMDGHQHRMHRKLLNGKS
jgi:cytochrome P450